VKHEFVLTESQRMALCTLIAEFMQTPDATKRFINFSQSPAVETTPEDLLVVFMMRTNVVEASAPPESGPSVPVVEAIRREMMARFAHCLSMEQIADCSYALARTIGMAH